MNFTEIASQLPMLLLLILGALMGLILVGKLMHYLLHHFKTHFYLAVLGIVVISPFNILFTLQENTSSNVFQASWLIYLLGAILFVLGIFITFSLSNKKEEPKGEMIHD